MKEIVLPSGRFATMRPITWFDRVVTRNDNTEAWIMGIAVRITKIDGEDLTFQQACDMVIEEAQPIIEVIAAQIAVAAASKGVS